MQKTLGGNLKMRGGGCLLGNHKQMGEKNMSSISSFAMMLIFGQLDMFHSLLQSLSVAVSKHLGHLFPAAVCHIPV